MQYLQEKYSIYATSIQSKVINVVYYNYILDADIKGFFDNIDHEWAVKFIESRIKDPNIIRLVRRMLKAGIMNDFVYEDTEVGSGQGGLCRYPHNPPYAELVIMPS